jgi:hypothetical protein
LKRANNDLENDRNTIRQNLKQMLELQMKEALQLLGLSNEPNSNTSMTNNRTLPLPKSSPLVSLSSQFTSYVQPTPSPPLPTPPPPPSKNYESSINEIINKFQINSLCKTNSPSIQHESTSFSSKNNKVLSSAASSLTSTSISSKSSSVSDLISSFQQQQQQPNSINSTNNNSTTMPIKDSFILNQIDLINQYYHIDNKTLSKNELTTTTTTKPLSSVSVSNIQKINNNNYKSQDNLNKTDSNDKQSVGRGNELRHYIEILLNRSPTSPSVDVPVQKNDFLSTINSANDTSLLAKKTNQSLIRSLSTQNISFATGSEHNRLSLFNKQNEKHLTLAPKKPDYLHNDNNNNNNFNAMNDYTDMDDTYNDLNNRTNFDYGEDKSKSLFQSQTNYDDEDEYNNNNDDDDDKKIKYNDISDLEDTGYMKRESTEYYDDVKRTLNFDEDEEEDEIEESKTNHVKFLYSTSTPTLMKENINKFSLLANDNEIQNVNDNVLDISNNKKKSCLTSKSQSNLLKKNSANSASTSQLSTSNQTNKKMSLKKIKSIKKSNNSNVSNISSISNRSLSMISLGQQQQLTSSSLASMQQQQQQQQHQYSDIKSSKYGKPIWK